MDSLIVDIDQLQAHGTRCPVDDIIIWLIREPGIGQADILKLKGACLYTVAVDPSDLLRPAVVVCSQSRSQYKALIRRRCSRSGASPKSKSRRLKKLSVNVLLVHRRCSSRSSSLTLFSRMEVASRLLQSSCKPGRAAFVSRQVVSSGTQFSMAASSRRVSTKSSANSDAGRPSSHIRSASMLSCPETKVVRRAASPTLVRPSH